MRGKIVRPLLEISRNDINTYIFRNNIHYVEDESNRDPRFTRNRLRLEVLPLLEEIAPGCSGRIAGTAELLREENGHIQREAERLLPPWRRRLLSFLSRYSISRMPPCAAGWSGPWGGGWARN